MYNCLFEILEFGAKKITFWCKKDQKYFEKATKKQFWCKKMG